MGGDPATSGGPLRGLLLESIWVAPEGDADENLLGWTWGTVGTLGTVLAGKLPHPLPISMAEISLADGNRADFAANDPPNLWENRTALEPRWPVTIKGRLLKTA